MSSISASNSGVNLSKAFKDAQFSTTCSGRDAPVMTAETFSFFKHHASASCARVIPSLSAMGYYRVSLDIVFTT